MRRLYFFFAVVLLAACRHKTPDQQLIEAAIIYPYVFSNALGVVIGLILSLIPVAHRKGLF